MASLVRIAYRYRNSSPFGSVRFGVGTHHCCRDHEVIVTDVRFVPYSLRTKPEQRCTTGPRGGVYGIHTYIPGTLSIPRYTRLKGASTQHTYICVGQSTMAFLSTGRRRDSKNEGGPKRGQCTIPKIVSCGLFASLWVSLFLYVSLVTYMSLAKNDVFLVISISRYLSSSQLRFSFFTFFLLFVPGMYIPHHTKLRVPPVVRQHSSRVYYTRGTNLVRSHE